MKFIHISALAAVSLALAACQTTSTQPKSLMSQGWFPMNDEQIVSVLSNNTLENPKWIAYYPSATEVKGLAGTDKKDSGVWEAKDGQYCRTYTTWSGGKEKCYTLHRRGNEILFPSGETAMVVDGNSKGL